MNGRKFVSILLTLVSLVGCTIIDVRWAETSQISPSTAANTTQPSISIKVESTPTLAEPFSPTDSPAPTPTKIPIPTKIPTIIVSATSTAISDTFYYEDFEDGIADSMYFNDNIWRVSIDNEGNKVLEGVNQDWGNELFVNLPPWSNYIIEYRVKIIDYDVTYKYSGITTFWFRESISRKNKYIFGLDSHWHKIYLASSDENNDWMDIQEYYVRLDDYYIDKGIWYDVRIEVEDNHFKAYVNNILVMSGMDSRFKQGRLGWNIFPETTAHFDEILIRYFE